jgi:peptidoglycan/LPS O-acetylase OafA/YrhL
VKRIPALDGIRGLAIAAILAVHSIELILASVPYSRFVHTLFGLLSTGWLGVDIFFVLSGFLITTILFEERTKPDFWSDFYLRRSLRILPPFAAVFGITILAIHFLLPAIRLTPAILLPAIFFLENWTILNNTDMPMLPQLWSLAVEEQFYLLWPQAATRLGGASILKLSIALAAATELLRIGLALKQVNPYVIYTITPTRIDGLSIGAALSAAMTLPRAQRFLALFWRRIALGSAVLWVVAFLVMHRILHPGNVRSQILAIPPTIVLTAMIIFGSVTSALPAKLGRLLASPVLTYLGRRSYAIYLLHYPILATVLQSRLHGRLAGLPPGFPVNILLTVTAIAASLVLAEISWRLIEAPAQTLRRFLERRKQRFSENAPQTL